MGLKPMNPLSSAGLSVVSMLGLFCIEFVYCFLFLTITELCGIPCLPRRLDRCTTKFGTKNLSEIFKMVFAKPQSQSG